MVPPTPMHRSKTHLVCVWIISWQMHNRTTCIFRTCVPLDLLSFHFVVYKCRHLIYYFCVFTLNFLKFLFLNAYSTCMNRIMANAYHNDVFISYMRNFLFPLSFSSKKKICAVICHLKFVRQMYFFLTYFVYTLHILFT